MASVERLASWHPAFMPNSIADLNERNRDHTIRWSPIRSSTATPPLQTLADTSNIDSIQELDTTENHDIDTNDTHEARETAMIASKDAESDLNTLRNALTKSLASPGGVEMNENPIHDGVLDGSGSPIKANFPSKGLEYEASHMSTASFTRSVPRDIDWGEDDDIDPGWNLHRTETDPFGLMAPSDRTNSFPQVPPTHLPERQTSIHGYFLERRTEGVLAVSTQSTKSLFAEEGEEYTNDGEFFAEVAGSYKAEAVDGSLDSHAGSTRDGDTLEHKFGDRYEEGLPLVEYNADEKDFIAQTQASSLFSGQDSEGDIFASIQGHISGEDYQPATMGRKSTLQVTSTAQFQPHNGPEFHALLMTDTISSQISSQTTSGGIAAPSSAVNSRVAGAPESIPIGQKANPNGKATEEDLAAKWKAAFSNDELLDDDELLLDEPVVDGISVDPADLFGSDDEGFLEDDEPGPNPVTSLQQTFISTAAPVANDGKPAGLNPIGGSHTSNVGSQTRYLPVNVTLVSAQQPSNSYVPKSPLLTNISSQNSASPYILGAPTTALAPGSSHGTQEQHQRSDPLKAQSFASKSKGGYASPYDLPMDIVKPRKRASLQQIGHGYNNPLPPNAAPPPRSSSMFTQGPPSRGSSSSISPPTTSQSFQRPSSQPPQKPSTATNTSPQNLELKGSFFEDLPVSSKPKPPGRYAPQPSSPAPTLHANSGPPRPYAPIAPASAVSAPPDSQGLVSPPRAGPYTPVHTSQSQQPALTSRYSPAPARTSSGYTPPPVVQGRYTIAPPRQQPSSISPLASAPAPVFPHQPRTSSPLAHFERSQDLQPHRGASPITGNTSTLQRGSSGLEHASRAPSLPMTQEVDELDAEDPNLIINQESYSQDGVAQHPQHRHISQSSQQPTQSPPAYLHRGRSSPSKQYNYVPNHRSGNQGQTFSAPQRSQTQSPPRAISGPYHDLGIGEPYKRPLSVHEPASLPQNLDTFSLMNSGASKTRPRELSQALNYIAPTDGRERDPLQRWKGGPVFAWGFGGTIITSFPKEVPRYGMNQTTPMIICSPGEIKVRSIKDIYPLELILADFPGPLKHKSKKKEILAWLSAGIDILEQQNVYIRSLYSLTHEDKRKEERILLWKILRVMVENDGVLEGNASAERAVRAILSPGLDGENIAGPQNTTGADPPGILRSAGSVMQAEPVDPAAVNQLRTYLLRGERERAVWVAVDKRLWAHAILISNTLSTDLYRRVAQEFVQKEVKCIGDNTESLAALYEIFAGNFEESVDELVPPSARAGLQMVSTSTISGPSKSSLDGLDRWRETLGLVLSNRSLEDNQAINALGKLLSGYGRAEAAHICFIFARSRSVFGGVDEPLSNIVLVGSDHLRQPLEFDRELEPVLLSEVYEYGLSLSTTSNAGFSAPHLVTYKLHHATILAEVGQRDKALQYCDAIANSIYSQTRRSPYHHVLLVSALEELTKRLKQSPKDESTSWITKPSMDKVSSSVWTKFNKFVAGDENDPATAPPGSEAGSDIGPFAKIAGGTPTISRPPSSGDLYGSYNGGSNLNGGTIPPTARTTTRYTSSGNYIPPVVQDQQALVYGSPAYSTMIQKRPSFEEVSTSKFGHPSSQTSRNQGEYSSISPYSPYLPSDMQHPGLAHNSSYPVTPPFVQSAPSDLRDSPPSVQSSERPRSPGYIAAEMNHNLNGSRYAPAISGSYKPPANSGYEPPSIGGYKPPSTSNYEPLTSSGYEPPSSSGYEPPSNNGYEPPTSNGYEPPSNSGYEPPGDNYSRPLYKPQEIDEPDSPINTKPKKKSYIDDNSEPPKAKTEKTKAEKDREADEAFRKAAEADAKKDATPAPKKGWGLGSWFSKKESVGDPGQPNKPIRAKLGEESSFYYDPELKRWINKKAGKDDTLEQSTGTPPPPRAGPPRAASGPQNPLPTSAPKPSGPPQRAASAFVTRPPHKQYDGAVLAAPPLMSRSISNGSASGPPSGPPSRPTTSMSNASSIDDLLGPPVARKGATKKAKKGRGYIDLMGEKASS